MLKGKYNQEIQEKRKDLQNKLQAIKKMAIGTYISMTLNVNGLNAPRDTDWLHVHKNKTIYMLSTRNPLQT